MMRSERVFIVKNMDRPARKGQKKETSMLFLLSRAKDLSPKTLEKLAWKLYLGSLAALLLTATPASAMTDEELMAFLGGGSKPKAAPAAKAQPLAKTAVVAAPVAAKVVTQPASASAGLTSREGEWKIAPKVNPAKIAKKLDLTLPEMTEAEKLADGEERSVKGPITGLGTSGLAVTFDVNEETGDSKEMWLDQMKNTKFSGVKSLADLEEGDTVSASYKLLAKSQKKLLLRLSLVSRKPLEVPQAPEPMTVPDAPEMPAQPAGQIR